MSYFNITDRLVSASLFCTNHMRIINELRVHPDFLKRWSKEIYNGSPDGYQGQKIKNFITENGEFPVIEDPTVREFNFVIDRPITLTGVDDFDF